MKRLAKKEEICLKNLYKTDSEIAIKICEELLELTIDSLEKLDKEELQIILNFNISNLNYSKKNIKKLGPEILLKIFNELFQDEELLNECINKNEINEIASKYLKKPVSFTVISSSNNSTIELKILTQVLKQSTVLSRFENFFQKVLEFFADNPEFDLNENESVKLEKLDSVNDKINQVIPIEGFTSAYSARDKSFYICGNEVFLSHSGGYHADAVNEAIGKNNEQSGEAFGQISNNVAIIETTLSDLNTQAIVKSFREKGFDGKIYFLVDTREGKSVKRLAKVKSINYII